MNPRMNQQIRLVARPKGAIKDSDFKLTMEAVRDIKNGEVLLKTLYCSLDPSQRNWMDDDPSSYFPPVKLGDVMASVCLSRVVDSRSPDFKRGDITWSVGGWQQYQIVHLSDTGEQFSGLTVMDVNPEIPLSNYLSACGISGLTAFAGIFYVGQPRIGETVLISAAAGSVGSIAGQIAKKICGSRVVGIAGTEEKCQWITGELGFDGAINYRQEKDMVAAIRRACPNGVDLYFDNVGGPILDAALMNINYKARVLMCGRIANYLDDHKNVPGPFNMWQLVVKSARIEGFLQHMRLGADSKKAAKLLELWTKCGLIKFREDIVDGLENTLEAFRSLFTGHNQGRLMVKVADASEPD